MIYTCPVCGFNDLEEPPAHYTICDCCGTEFGNSDKEFTVDELRNQWVRSGAQWFSAFYTQPIDWSASAQMDAAGLVVSDTYANIVLALLDTDTVTDEDRQSVFAWMRNEKKQINTTITQTAKSVKDSTTLVADFYRKKTLIVAGKSSLNLSEIDGYLNRAIAVRERCIKLEKELKDIETKMDAVLRAAKPEPISSKVLLQLLIAIQAVLNAFATNAQVVSQMFDAVKQSQVLVTAG